MVGGQPPAHVRRPAVAHSNNPTHQYLLSLTQGQVAPPPAPSPQGQVAPPPSHSPQGQVASPPAHSPQGQSAPPPAHSPQGQVSCSHSSGPTLRTKGGTAVCGGEPVAEVAVHSLWLLPTHPPEKASSSVCISSWERVCMPLCLPT